MEKRFAHHVVIQNVAKFVGLCRSVFVANPNLNVNVRSVKSVVGRRRFPAPKKETSTVNWPVYWPAAMLVLHDVLWTGVY